MLQKAVHSESNLPGSVTGLVAKSHTKKYSSSRIIARNVFATHCVVDAKANATGNKETLALKASGLSLAYGGWLEVAAREIEDVTARSKRKLISSLGLRTGFRC